MKKVFTTTAVAFILSMALQAQEIKVTSQPDTSVILIGDQTGFTVTAAIPAGVTAEISDAADTLAGKIVILGRTPRDTALLSDGTLKITDRYLITSFDSGSYTIPPFFAERESGDSLIRFYSDYSSIKVLRPDVTPQDTTDVIFDIVPPRSAPVTISEILPWIILALIAAVVIYLLARFLPRNPLSRFVKPVPPPEQAHVIALRDLQELKAAELWQKGEIKEYYSRLSDILRRYLDNRYGISSPELTTDETVRMLHKAAVTTTGQMALVKEVLSLSDMVKFAKYVPDSGVHDATHDNAIRFVEETREPEVMTPEGQADGGKADRRQSGKSGTGPENAGKTKEKEKGGQHA
jgi:hypothetical protein